MFRSQSAPEKRAVPPFLHDIPIIGGPSRILEPSDISAIRACLPMRLRSFGWSLAFRISDDGCSYSSLFSRCRKDVPAIFVISTDKRERLGAFLPVGVIQSSQYYGNGSSFVFKLSPSFQMYPWKGPDSNSWFARSSGEEIIIGGDSSAIWIGPDLLAASSKPCSTFGSPTLTSRDRFSIADIEIWMVQSSLSVRKNTM
jgi:hypothetical protein